MSDSFPCIVCGGTLERAFEDYESQPNDGVMCSATGNYGSTVFDPMDLSELAFNLCDVCLVQKAEEGRVMVTRYHYPITMDGMGIVGRQSVKNPVYIPWQKGLPEDGKSLDLDPEDLDNLPDDIDLRFTVEQIKQWLAGGGVKGAP